MAYLTKIITGKASILLTMQLTPDILASYPKTRDVLLDSVGLSYHHYAELFFHPSKSWDATPESVHHGTVSALTVILRGAKSLDDAKWIITRLQVLMQYTPECLHHVVKFKPEGPAELFRLIHSYEEMHGNATHLRYKKHQRSPQPYQQLFDRKIPYQEPTRTNEVNARASLKEQHREMDDIVCYSCGKTGHKIAQCPAKSANTFSRPSRRRRYTRLQCQASLHLPIPLMVRYRTGTLRFTSILQQPSLWSRRVGSSRSFTQENMFILRATVGTRRCLPYSSYHP